MRSEPQDEPPVRAGCSLGSTSAGSDDAAIRLRDELRVHAARLGSALAVATYLRGEAESALARLREALARSGRIREAMAPIGDQFEQLYARLRQTMEEVARSERRSGASPEHTQQLLHSLVRDTTAHWFTPETADLLDQSLVQYGMEAYHAA